MITEKPYDGSSLFYLCGNHFVEVLQSTPRVEQEEKTTGNDDFFALAGMWVGRDITAEEFSTKAWPIRY